MKEFEVFGKENSTRKITLGGLEREINFDENGICCTDDTGSVSFLTAENSTTKILKSRRKEKSK